jgi:hypothetical protein
MGTGISGIITNSIVFSINYLYTICQKDIEDAIFWPD